MLISQHVYAALLAAMKDAFVAKLLSGINFSKVKLLGIKKPGQNVPALYLKLITHCLVLIQCFQTYLPLQPVRKLSRAALQSLHYHHKQLLLCPAYHG